MIALRPVGNEKPVLALAFVGEWLAAGVGTFVRLYAWRSGELLGEVQVFGTNRVHGLAPLGDGALLAWGGRSCARIDIDPAGRLAPQREARMSDWVVSCAAHDGVVYALLAHNEVRELDFELAETGRVHRCGEASLLYSGRLFLAAGKRLVAAGTVLCGIVVWDLDTDSVVRAFKVHKGVVFDVAWSPDGAQLASCSDDRSVSVLDVATGAAQCGYAHASRVWRVQFLGAAVVSTGEDCTARVWARQRGALVAQRVLCAHGGRNVWSLALRDAVAATGGADGRVVLWDLALESTAVSYAEDALASRVRSVAVDAEGACAAATLAGTLFVLRGTEWRDAGLRLGQPARVKACGTSFFVLTTDGAAALVSGAADAGAPQLFRVPAGVVDFFPVSATQLVVQGRDYLILYDVASQETAALAFPNGDCAQVTAACLHGECTVLGTRRGDVLLVSGLSTSTNLRAFDCAAPVTSLTPVGSTIVATTLSGHVGTFAVPSLARLTARRARRRGSVEGTNGDPADLLFCGFQNASLLAWDASSVERAALACGGRHRVHAHAFVGNALVLAFVRAHRVYVAHAAVRSERFARAVLSAGTHGREIRCAEASPVDASLLAMGSEDTAVTLARLRDGQLDTQCVLRGHISAVQSVHWTPDGRFLLSGGGMGELVAWEVQTVDGRVFANRMGATPATTGAPVSDALRVMSFSVHGDVVAAAYSDSSLRVWRMEVDLDTNGTTLAWTLLATLRYAECCLLHIEFVSAFRRLWLLVTATDGHLAMYAVELHPDRAALRQELRLRVHQSGVRAARFVHNVTDDELWCYTAGDDNALRATRLRFDPGLRCVVSSEAFLERSAHTAALTALVLDCDHNFVISTGSDQRIRFWDMKTGRRLASFTTDVCDTGVLVQLKDTLVVAGIGVGIYALETSTETRPPQEPLRVQQ